MADSVERIVSDLLAQLRRAPQDLGMSSSYNDVASLIRDIEVLGVRTSQGDEAATTSLRVLFAPTGVLQDTAIASGWHDEYMRLAERMDHVG